MKKILLLILLSFGLLPCLREGKITIGYSTYAQSFGDEYGGDGGWDDPGGDGGWGDGWGEEWDNGDTWDDNSLEFFMTVEGLLAEIAENGLSNFQDGYYNFQFDENGVLDEETSTYYSFDEIRNDLDLVPFEIWELIGAMNEYYDQEQQFQQDFSNNLPLDPNQLRNYLDSYYSDEDYDFRVTGNGVSIFDMHNPGNVYFIRPGEPMPIPWPELPWGDGPPPGSEEDEGLSDWGNIDFILPDYNNTPDIPYDPYSDEWFYWYYGEGGTYSVDPTTPPNPQPVVVEKDPLELDAEFNDVSNYVTPSGTPITLPPGSKIFALKSVDPDLYPNGALYGFEVNGIEYAARLTHISALTTSTPEFLGYYKISGGQLDLNSPYSPPSTQYPTADKDGIIEVVRLTIDTDNSPCKLKREVVDYHADASFPPSIPSSSTPVNYGIEDEFPTEGDQPAENNVDCPTQQPTEAQGNDWDLNEYIQHRGIPLVKFLKDQVQSNVKIYLYDCATNQAKYTVTKDGANTVPAADQAAQINNFNSGNFSEDIAIKGCIENGKWNYDIKFNNNLDPDPKVAPVLQEVLNEIKRQADDEVKRIKNVGTVNKGQEIDAGNGEKFRKSDMEIFQAIAAIYDVGKHIVEDATLPPSVWDRGNRAAGTPAPDGTLEEYNNSPFNMPAVLGGGTDQLIDEVTGAVQLAKTGLEFLRDPKGTFDGIWKGIKTLDKDKMLQILGSASGVDNYTAGGDRAFYQGGKHGVQMSMIFFAGVKNLTDGTDIVKKTGDEIDDLQKFLPDGTTNNNVSDALKNAAENNELIKNIDNEKLLTRNVENGENMVVVAEKNADDIDLYKVKESELIDGRTGTPYTMDDIADGAVEVDLPRPETVLDPVTDFRRVETPAGSKGAWNKELNNPKGNREYVVGNSGSSHKYTTDADGRVAKVEVESLSLSARDRNGYQQSVKCKSVKDGIDGDQGGHLIGSRFDGAGEQINVLPMRGDLNLSEWKVMENDWADALSQQPPQNVKVDVRPLYNGDSKRPYKFEVRYQIGSQPPVLKTFDN